MSVVSEFWRPFNRLAAVSALALALGCGAEESGSSAANAASTARTPAAPAHEPAKVDASAEAKSIFGSRCFTCHGPAGGGDGPGSRALSPRPRNFQDPVWQDEVSDDHIAQIIMYGGAAVGRSPSMPGNPDLSARPQVIAALVAYVRGLRSK